MIQPVRVEFCSREYQSFNITSEGPLKGFPLFPIDADSYIDGGEIQSRLNFPPYEGRHCIAIGKSCSLATGVEFMVDLNHDYSSITMGAVLGEMQPLEDMKAPRRGSIIIQNDVWVGYNATIMASVTLRNGCVVAAGSVVTKDVPPYAIVGGNPAKIIRYRFDKDVIDAFQRIAWWDWTEEQKRERRADFSLSAKDFTDKYLPYSDLPELNSISEKDKSAMKAILFFPDLGEPLPLYPEVLRRYFEKDRPNAQMILFIIKENINLKSIENLEREVAKYQNNGNSVKLLSGTNADAAAHMANADYYITTRGRETVKRTCLADLYNTKILYGTDLPIFPEFL